MKRSLVKNNYSSNVIMRLSNTKKLETLSSALIAGENSGIGKRKMKDILKDAKKRHANKV